jgi:hypothetical protein
VDVQEHEGGVLSASRMKPTVIVLLAVNKRKEPMNDAWETRRKMTPVSHGCHQCKEFVKTCSTKHMNCDVAIARLEAQVAAFLAYMERFRSSLQREEYDQ